MVSKMAKTQSYDGRDAQEENAKTVGPIYESPRGWPRDLPANLLSLEFSNYSDDELRELYESSRREYSTAEVNRARGLELESREQKLARRYERAKKNSKGATSATTSAATGSSEINRSDGESARNSNDSPELTAKPSLTGYDVKGVIRDEFNEEGWTVMKPLLATHATLLLDDIESSRAIMVEGQSGVGKTMLLKTFGGLNEQFCRRSDITPASFVSAGPSKSAGGSTNTDLLPQLEGRTLAVRDAQTLFGGSEQTIRSRWGTMARIMDGDGYFRQTATHGKAGYDDIRFNFIGATTPLSPRAWRMMGNVGQRLLFVEWPEEEYEDGWLTSVVDGGERRPIERGQEVVQEFLHDLWEFHGGSSSVAWDDERPNEVIEVIEYLAKVVTYARASITNGEPQREAPKRIGKLLHDLARGHALIHGRTRLELGDVEVCGRVALSTMPSKRRELVRALLDPNRDAPLTASDVETILDVSRPTARDRIDDVVALGFGEVVEATGRGGTTKAVEVNSEFRWPDGVPFPEF